MFCLIYGAVTRWLPKLNLLKREREKNAAQLLLYRKPVSTASQQFYTDNVSNIRANVMSRIDLTLSVVIPNILLKLTRSLDSLCKAEFLYFFLDILGWLAKLS